MSTISQGIELFNIFAETWGKEKAQIAIKDIEEIIDARKQDLATKSDIKEIELKIEQAKSSTIKWVVGWMVGLLIAQTGAILTMFALFK
ncbi:MAG: hypothetical protein K6U11_12595 [bacterium]|nr:hypothetical protein [bacterium]